MLYLPPDPKEGQTIRARDIAAILRYLRSITPRSSGTCDVRVGSGGATFSPKFPQSLAGLRLNPNSAWPFKVYDASAAGVLQVRVNSGDGYAGSINSVVATVNSTPITTPTPPATAPLLASGAGVVYIKATLTGDGSSTVTAVECLYASSMPAADTASPPTYALQLLANLTAMGSGSTAWLAVDNVTNYGFTGLQVCGGSVVFY